MQMKKNAILPILLILSLLLSACGSRVPRPADGYDLVLVTDSPEENGSGTQTNTDGEKKREASTVQASDLFSGYGFCHQLCGESGYYRFTPVNSQNVIWQVYILDQEFRDAERYIPQAYDKALEGSGVIHIDAGKWIYVYCSCNEWTGAEAPEGCAYSWVLDPNATAADVTVPAETKAEQSSGPDPVTAQDPAPSPTPTPTPAPTPKVLTITKHPTAETVQQGGTCWFVARADNADSITWEFLDTAGAVCSVDNAKTRNPGFTMEIYDNGETVGLKNIPMSMNGWQARAKFTGCGTSLYSNPAAITVTAISDFKTAYSSVFENYISLAGGGDDQYELWTDLTLSGITLGYFLKDLDGDGTEELIVGQIGGTTGSLWDKVVYSAFTLNNGKPVKLLKSNARDRYYYNGSGFIHEGSGGADSSDIYSCRYSNGTLTVINGVYTTAEGFFYVENGDRESGTGIEVSSDQFNACMVSYEGSIKDMTAMLTPIA